MAKGVDLRKKKRSAKLILLLRVLEAAAFAFSGDFDWFLAIVYGDV